MDIVNEVEFLKKTMKVHTLYNHYLDKVIKIYEMVHIAPIEFYEFREQQFAKDVGEGYVLQVEGAKMPRISEPLHESYRAIAEILEWEMQKTPTTEFTNIDISWDDLNTYEKTLMISMVKMMGFFTKKLSKISSSEKEEYKKKIKNIFLDKMVEENDGIFVPRIFRKILLEKRNDIAIKGAMSHRGNVSLSWGQLHSEGMIKILKSYGFVEIL